MWRCPKSSTTTCMYMYIYIYVWVYIHMHVCMYAYLYIYTYRYVYIHMCMHIYVYAHIYIYWFGISCWWWWWWWCDDDDGDDDADHHYHHNQADHRYHDWAGLSWASSVQLGVQLISPAELSVNTCTGDGKAPSPRLERGQGAGGRARESVWPFPQVNYIYMCVYICMCI